MTSDEIKKLRKHYHILLRQQPIFEEHSKSNISEHAVNQMATTIRRIESDFPGLLPPFALNQFFSHRGGGDNVSYYVVSGILSYLATALGILEVEVETDEGNPVTEMKEFYFIKDIGIRRCLERDYTEIQRAFIARCWKSVIILSGGAIEAILTDLLVENAIRATQSQKAPKQKDITR